MQAALSSVRRIHTWLKQFPETLEPGWWGGLVPVVVQYVFPQSTDRESGILRNFRLLMRKPDGSLLRFGGSLHRGRFHEPPCVVKCWDPDTIAHVLAVTGTWYEPEIPDALEEMLVRMYAHDAPHSYELWLEEREGPYSTLGGMGLYLDAREQPTA